MTITLDSQHELLLLDDGSIKIFRDFHDGSERYVVALSRASVQKLLDRIAIAEIRFYGDTEPEDMPIFDVKIQPIRKVR